MKTIQILLISVVLVFMSSCKGPKGVVDGVSLEGEKIRTETIASTGISLGDALNEDGTGIVKIPYKWYSGTAKVNDKQMAITTAQGEAYATISRTILNTVNDKVIDAGLANNGVAHRALKTYWEQKSLSIQKGAEPFGENIISYDPNTKMYDVTAKVGIRGDKYNSFIKDATNFKPDNLSQEELNDFIKVNKAIIDAAKGE